MSDTTTRLSRITASNRQALQELGYRIPMHTLGKTYVVFDGTPQQAAKAVQSAMDAVRRESPHGGRDSNYCSLIAVRNRLRRMDA